MLQRSCIHARLIKIYNTALLNKSIEQIKYEYQIDGFSQIIPSNDFSNRLLAILKERYDTLKNWQSRNGSYKVDIYRSVDLLNPINFELHEFKRFCDFLIKKLEFKEKYFDSIFSTYDCNLSRHSAQAPHFDRIPTLKFMLYLNDLNAKNGAFCLSPGSQHWVTYNYPKPRKEFNVPGFQEETRNIPNVISNRLRSIEGKAGTIIVFNTDCVHCQGIVREGSCRIIRAHYRDFDASPATKQPKYIAF